MSLLFVALIIVLIAVLVLMVREALRTLFFVPVLALLLLGFWMFLGNPVGLLVSVGGWIWLLLIVWAARILAVTMQAAIDAARDRPQGTR